MPRAVAPGTSRGLDDVSAMALTPENASRTITMVHQTIMGPE
jgi:hypothetical protein